MKTPRTKKAPSQQVAGLRCSVCDAPRSPRDIAHHGDSCCACVEHSTMEALLQDGVDLNTIAF